MNGLMKHAAGSRQRLDMIYINKNTQLSQRIIKVIGVTESTIIAYCFHKRQFRTFNLATYYESLGKAKEGSLMHIKRQRDQEWTAMMLTEHVKTLKELNVDYGRVNNTVIDEQGWEQINETLLIAIEYSLPVVFTLLHDGLFDEIEGKVHFID